MSLVQYGLDFPPFNELSDPHVVMEIAAAAEDAGWDGVFVWDHILYRAARSLSIADPWIFPGSHRHIHVACADRGNGHASASPAPS